MRLIYRKKIRIGAITFRILYDPKSDGAEFSYPTKKRKAFIRIGTLYAKTAPAYVFGLILHELKEILQIEQSTRYFHPGEWVWSFHYNHSEHTALCCQLAGLLEQFIE